MTRMRSNSQSEDKDNMTLYFGVTLLLSIAVPFLYYSLLINMYAQENQPSGFNFPKITDFWRVIVGGCVT